VDNFKQPGKVVGNANREIGAPNGAPTWHSRGYLPHFESSDVIQHVTFHLADSLPQTVLLQLESELKFLSLEKRAVERRKQIDAWIDAGHGSCILRTPAIADMVQDSLLTFDSQRYRLLAWVVMPNHVHVLFQPMNGWTVAKIVAAWKKFTARKIRDFQRTSGNEPTTHVWHREYWDRYIRDQNHLIEVIQYIHLNPVKAGLAATPDSWRWSGAYSGNANLPIGTLKTAIQENGVPRRKP
jgi:REP element-mobilizing transposase RayT